MKNTRIYRFPAFLLAIIMVIGFLPVTAMADGTSGVYNLMQGNGTFYSDITKLVNYTYASDGTGVSSVAELDPNKTSTMTVTAADESNMFAPVNGEMRVSLPEFVEISGEDAAACVSDEVTCIYRASENKLVFKWKEEKESAFTATLTITPAVPETLGLSGKHVIATEKNQKTVGAVKAQTRSDNRLVTSKVSMLDGKMSFDNNSSYLWTFTHVTGDWYTISNGSYMKMAGNALTLTDRQNATIFHVRNEASGYVIENNGYYLNIKSDNPDQGMQGSNWAPMSQFVKLYSASDLFTASDSDNGYIKLDKNGGSTAMAKDVLSAEVGATVTLPGYTGRKSNKEFIGWARYSNIYDKHDGNNNSYCEVYLPGTEFTVTRGVTTLYAVFNEKSADVRFGFRRDGNIPVEPGDYDTKLYYGHMTISNALKTGRWVVDVDGNKPIEGNHVANNVASNLSILPTDEQIKANVKNYDPETMYVHWYVLKYAGQWKVDGVIRTRASKSVGYDPNMENENRNYIQNMPNGYEFGQKATITIGADQDGNLLTPSLNGYEFLGWNTEAKGTGQAYKNGDTLNVSSSVTFYAQWKEIPKYEVSFRIARKPRNVQLPESVMVQENGVVTLPAAEEHEDYIFSGWTVNGEKKAEGETFTMPADDVIVEGTYYGPIDVDIVSDWKPGQVGYPGAKINLTAVVSGPENLDYDYQWQYQSGDEWITIEGATEVTYSYELNAETSGRIWRVTVTDARLHQD